MKLSVVIPTYNRVNLLTRAIDSILAQSHPATEIIVVDDGSSDETQQLIEKKYPQTNYIFQENKGVSAARNIGIKNTRYDWVCLLDSDDSWQRDKLEKQIRALNDNPDYLACHTNETWYRNGKILSQKKKHEKHGGFIFQHCLPLCAMSPSSIMLNKQLFDELGFFDESLPACEDYDMWLRICCRYPVLFLDEPLTNKYGGHEDQLSQKHWGMDRFRILALEKVIKEEALSNSDKQAATEMLLHKIKLFLKGAEKHGKNDYCDKFETLLRRYA